jgi:hypothetical protein
LNVWFNDQFGFGKVILFGALCQLGGYIIIAPGPPFPALVCVYVLVGFGNALQVRQFDTTSLIYMLTSLFRLPSQTGLSVVCMSICQRSLGFCMGRMVCSVLVALVECSAHLLNYISRARSFRRPIRVHFFLRIHQPSMGVPLYPFCGAVPN